MRQDSAHEAVERCRLLQEAARWLSLEGDELERNRLDREIDQLWTEIHARDEDDWTEACAQEHESQG